MLCPTCSCYNVVHIPGCKSLSKCLLCCGCYDDARQQHIADVFNVASNAAEVTEDKSRSTSQAAAAEDKSITTLTADDNSGFEANDVHSGDLLQLLVRY